MSRKFRFTDFQVNFYEIIELRLSGIDGTSRNDNSKCQHNSTKLLLEDSFSWPPASTFICRANRHVITGLNCPGSTRLVDCQRRSVDLWKGTGKSAVTNAWLLEASSRTEGIGYIPLIINYSARTTAKQTQDGIMVKMDRRRKGIYGPPVGKRCIARDSHIFSKSKNYFIFWNKSARSPNWTVL